MSLRRNFSFALATLLTVAGAGLFNPAQAGSLSYEIIFDTTSLTSGAGGLVDMTLSPATAPASPSVSVLIDHYTSDGTVFPGGVLGTPAGTASGDLTTSGGVTMDNTVYSELTQNFTVASFFDVFVTLSGSEVGAGASGTFSGTAFTFTIFDSGTGSLAQTFLINPTGIVDGTISYPPTPGITVIPQTSTIPEPSSVVLLGLGLGAFAVAGRFRNRSAA